MKQRHDIVHILNCGCPGLVRALFLEDQMIRRCLGLDPGLATATAAVFGYADGSRSPDILGIFDIPTRGDGTAKRIDVQALFDWLEKMNPQIAYLENASTMPSMPDQFGNRRGMGIASSGRYMRAAGALEACVELFGIDIVMVQPRTWKAALGLSGSNKGGSLDLIRGLYPDMVDIWFKRKKDHNRAEATLLAIYGAARADLISLKMAA
jgi:hypothetical protein